MATETGTMKVSAWTGGLFATNDEAGTLTAMDIKALRQADQIVFRHYRGAAQIEAIKRLDNEPFATEARYDVAVFASEVYDYSSQADAPRERQWSCFAMLHAAQHNERWRTICELVRTGDTVSFHWGRSNNNGYLDDAALAFDTLSIIIRRGNKKYTIQVNESITSDNSARMVRIDS